MGIYKQLAKNWQKESDAMAKLRRERLIEWRREPSTLRISRPTRLDRARSLGYKPKKGIILLRQRVSRGGHVRGRPGGGRHSSNMTSKLNLRKSYHYIAEERAMKEYSNCEVLNSYYVAEDGKYYWYEIIMIDRSAPEVLADKNLRGIAGMRGRVFRGLTRAGRKTRGLMHKGKGSEKTRPSRRSD